jgi:hypothetical protein
MVNGRTVVFVLLGSTLATVLFFQALDALTN